MPRLFFIIFLLFSIQTAQSQLRVKKPVKKAYPRKTNLAFGVSSARSVLFLERNVKANNDATGLAFHALYGGANIFRIGLEYTHYYPIDIAPTWYNIHSNTFEMNGHLIARFNSFKGFFYPFFGLSYNHFSGYFTGKNDFMGLSQKYGINSTIVTNWIGLNVGTGFEVFLGSLSAFADYKMRIGSYDGIGRNINIADVCYNIGLRYKIKVPSWYSIFGRYYFNGTGKRYHLDLEKD